MGYITPENLTQISFGSLDEGIEQDNQVRFFEIFVEWRICVNHDRLQYETMHEYFGCENID
jgi:hypothetical protein